ncbi:hypothetical protein Tco_0629417 [Tanacetum coccineum]|uniref:Tf2-1-like SH3-like domain-containing protein n=1 Tax=Tanacetum coccineum TaxID=301880 RepID=A0ABQ4WTA9_9ASTR
MVWIHLQKERFPQGSYSKLKSKGAGPFKVLKKIRENAYKIDLLADYEVSNTFNVSDLISYQGDSDCKDSRTSLLQPGENNTEATTETENDTVDFGHIDSTLLVQIQKIPEKNLDVLKVHEKNLDLLKVIEKDLKALKLNKGASENVSKEVKKTSDAPIIKDWVSDCDEDETVVLESLDVQKPKQADQPRKVCQNPRNNSTSWNTPMPKKLGVGFLFTPKACFVCGSFNHLIKDCDFHDKRMVQKLVLNNVKMGTGQREIRPVWTNAMRVNHQKFSNSRRNFAPTAVLTKSGLIPFSTVRQSFSRTTTSVSAARSFKTAAPKP